MNEPEPEPGDIVAFTQACDLAWRDLDERVPGALKPAQEGTEYAEGHKERHCLDCAVSWKGAKGGRCWVCGGPIQHHGYLPQLKSTPEPETSLRFDDEQASFYDAMERVA